MTPYLSQQIAMLFMYSSGLCTAMTIAQVTIFTPWFPLSLILGFGAGFIAPKLPPTT